MLADGRSDPNPVSNVHFAPYFEDEDRSNDANQQSCEGGAKQRRTFGGWALAIVSGVFAASWLRRRRRPR